MEEFSALAGNPSRAACAAVSETAAVRPNGASC